LWQRLNSFKRNICYAYTIPNFNREQTEKKTKRNEARNEPTLCTLFVCMLAIAGQSAEQNGMKFVEGTHG